MIKLAFTVCIPFSPTQSKVVANSPIFVAGRPKGIPNPYFKAL